MFVTNANKTLVRIYVHQGHQTGRFGYGHFLLFINNNLDNEDNDDNADDNKDDDDEDRLIGLQGPLDLKCEINTFKSPLIKTWSRPR